MKIRSALSALVLIGMCSAAMAQWQWLDKDGRRVFSDRAPPPDVMEKDILKRPAGSQRPAAAKPAAATEAAAGAEDGASSPAAPQVSGLDKELQARKKAAADAEAAKRKADEERMTKARVENCARAKQAAVTLDSGLRISRAAANGEREILDDASRAAERAQVQRTIDSECR